MAPTFKLLGHRADQFHGIDKLWDTLASMGNNAVGTARLEVLGLFIFAVLALGAARFLMLVLSNEYYR